MAESIKAYRADPYSYREARELAERLGLSEPVAITLVRRGYRTPEQALAFLEADESHDPGEFDSMAAVVARIRAAVEAGERITVHGDFDVDGVCATAIMVGALRELGADCDWLIPDRLADGYGLSAANVELLAERGTKLLVTVDCGVTAVEEVARARRAGDRRDRHRPPPAGRGAARLPDPAPVPGRLPVRGAVRDGGRLEVGLCVEGRPTPSKSQTWIWWPLPPLPMSSRWWVRTGLWSGAGWSRFV